MGLILMSFFVLNGTKSTMLQLCCDIVLFHSCFHGEYYCKNRSRMIKYLCPEKDSHNFPVLSHIYFAQMDSFPEFVRTFYSHEDSATPSNFK